MSNRTILILAITAMVLGTIMFIVSIVVNARVNKAVNCHEFDNHAVAQDFFEKHAGRGIDSPLGINDPYGLDLDHDGQACESLP